MTEKNDKDYGLFKFLPLVIQVNMILWRSRRIGLLFNTVRHLECTASIQELSRN